MFFMHLSKQSSGLEDVFEHIFQPASIVDRPSGLSFQWLRVQVEMHESLKMTGRNQARKSGETATVLQLNP